MQYQFDVAEHESYGTIGLKPQWYPDGDPLGGMGAAHDILEHFRPDEGGAEGEFMALGASYRLRGETGYFQRHGNAYPPTTHLAADFPEIARVTIEQRGSFRVRPCPTHCRVASEVSDAFSEMMRVASKEWREEWAEDGEAPFVDDKAEIMKWLVLGYVKAGQRYDVSSLKRRGIGFHELAYNVFQQIEEQVETALKHAEVGMVVTVHVNLRQCQVRVECDYPTEDE